MRDARSLIAAAALALAAGGCVTAGRARANAARVPLSAADSSYVAVMQSTDARSIDSAAFARAFAAPAAWVRSYAAISAGQLGAASLAPRLRALLSDADASVAARAAYSLGLLHDTASVGSLALAGSGRPEVGVEAVWALGEIGAPARETLLGLVAAPDLSETVRTEAVLAAGRLRPAPVAELTPLLSHPALAVRWAAAYALTRSRHPAATSALLAAAKADEGAHPGPQTARSYAAAASVAELRSFIARGLARAAAGDSLADRARAQLARYAADPDAHVRISAVRALSTYGALEREAVQRATADADPNVRISAAEAYTSTTDRDPATWAALWAADSAVAFRRSLLVGATGAGVRLPALREWAADSNWHRRAAVAQALSAPGADSLDPGLTRALLADRDGRVRAAAVGALAARLDSTGVSQPERATLLGALDDADPYVAAAAIDALAASPRAGEIASVVRSYRAHSGAAALDARVAALRYVVAAWTASPNSDEVLAAVRDLAAGPPPRSPLERLVVRAVPAFGAWRVAAVAPHDRAFYERVMREIVRPALGGRRQTAVFVTVRGPITVDLLPLDAPLTVDNFVTLARGGTYRGGDFHRVVPNFVAQDGDQRGDGNGGVGYAIRDEFNPVRYTRGTLGMALSGPDTGGSQYFLTLSSQPHLDGHYTVFGRAISGWSALDALVQGDRLDDVRIDW